MYYSDENLYHQASVGNAYVLPSKWQPQVPVCHINLLHKQKHSYNYGFKAWVGVL